MIHSNTWNFVDLYWSELLETKLSDYSTVFTDYIFKIYVKTGFGIKKQQWLTCQKTKPNLYFLYDKYFWLLSWYFGPIWTWTLIRLHCTFICKAFKSHSEWSNVQCVSSPNTIILTTTAWTARSHDIWAINQHVPK